MQDDEEYVFKSEDEMVSYFIDAHNLSQSFYWNKRNDNPDNITVGANITDDNQLVISLTVDGNHKTEADYYLKLKKFSWFRYWCYLILQSCGIR